ncbi:hypothetical protein DFO73_10426 [Cytobacillus oceanisediminis]|uniref:Uncharacterized protein n=1 Tax=Cytobacillus oceanisediminis TaxID=665099 RepID=A0A2V2ZY53_9BACI|nr:hypothetical protein [Cytobacillus oceanisediminis]PWW29395.1 hypothetical protein DFO73_10426 [Cytobacillus oceanisediminis]
MFYTIGVVEIGIKGMREGAISINRSLAKAIYMLKIKTVNSKCAGILIAIKISLWNPLAVFEIISMNNSPVKTLTLLGQIICGMLFFRRAGNQSNV